MCDKCNGKGELMEETDKCKVCKGAKIVDNEKNLEIPIEPGVPHEFSLKFTGEGDEAVSLSICTCNNDLFYILSQE